MAATTPQPRRSSRLRSATPQQEETVQRTKADNEASLRKTGSISSLKKSTMMFQHYERKAEMEAKLNAPSDPTPPVPSAPPAKSPERPITPPDNAIPSPAAPASTSLWGSLTKYFTSSWTASNKKRSAEDEPAPEEPAQKRQKPSQPQPASAPAELTQKPSEPSPRPTPGKRVPTAIERSFHGVRSTITDQTPSKRQAAAVAQPVADTPHFGDQFCGSVSTIADLSPSKSEAVAIAQSAATRDITEQKSRDFEEGAIEQPSTSFNADKSHHTQQKPHEAAIEQSSTSTSNKAPPSTQQTPKRPAASTTTQPPATAPPRTVTFAQPDLTPKRKRVTATSVAVTPLPAIAEASPQDMDTITPRPRRSIASMRAAKSERKATAGPERRYAWETKPTQVRERNADARLARIRRAEELRKELKELEEAEETLRPVKRVKVDNLVHIPHNRPGDPSGTFRLPDWDSDDEMEVFEDVEERDNIFAASVQKPTATMPPTQRENVFSSSVQQQSTPMPPAQPAAAPSQKAFAPALPTFTPAPTAKSAVTPAPASAALPPPVFDFPSVGPKPTDYYVTPEYQRDAGNLFAAGFNEWVAAQ